MSHVPVESLSLLSTPAVALGLEVEVPSPETGSRCRIGVNSKSSCISTQLWERETSLERMLQTECNHTRAKATVLRSTTSEKRSSDVERLSVIPRGFITSRLRSLFPELKTAAELGSTSILD